MHTAVLLAALVVGGHPSAPHHGGHMQRRPALGERFANCRTYCYWAYHGAYYQQWPYYDYRLEFDYPWFAHPHLSTWQPCGGPVIEDLRVLPPDDLDPLGPRVIPLFSEHEKPTRVTRIGKRSTAAVRR